MKLIVLATLLFSLPNIGYAKDNYYVGTGVAAVLLNSEGFTAPGADFVLLSGYQFSANLAAEIQYIGTSELKDSSTIQPRFLSGSLIGFFPISEQISIYSRFGIARWEADIQLGEFRRVSKSGIDITLGAGFEFQINKHYSIRQDIQYFSLDEGDAGRLGFSLIYQF